MIRTKQTEMLSMICILLAAVFSIIMFCQPVQELRTPADQLKAQLSDDYSTLLFDDSYVHEINILISDLNWDYLTSHAVDEQYVRCDAEIDGELIKNVAIRPKGNSSLSAVSNNGDTHFSFKMEFDKYDKLQTYHGLDKLSLGNLGQDPSCMKDFIAYHMMNEMDVPAPLSSYTLVKLNGEEFGLYLAAEAVEDSFCYRNYGSDFGTLYKPDSFAMDTLDDYIDLDSELSIAESIMNGERYAEKQSGDRVDIMGELVISGFSGMKVAESIAALQYVSDNEKDYSLIFDTAVFDITEADKRRLMDAVRTLNTSDTPTDALDIDTLLRYFAVHNFVNNYDSSNSFFVHNFYLHEKDGRFSFVPWDYNLAFGTFTYENAVGSILSGTDFDYLPPEGNAMNSEMSMVNYPIDTPTYSIPIEERPVLNALLGNEETLAQYHAYCNELLSDFFENGQYDTLFAQVYEQIRPYIEKNLTFYTTEKFDKGAEAINAYCHLRAESVREQLNGTIPTTAEGQKNAPETLINTDTLNLTDLTNFSSLLAGMDTDTISRILHLLLQDDYEYTTKGAVQAIKHYVSNPSELTGMIPELLQIPVIARLVSQKLTPYLLMPISVIILIIAVIFTKKYRRRNNAVKT